MSRVVNTGRVKQARALLEEAGEVHSPAVFAASFGVEDMVLLDLISKHARAIGVFTLDTGRLPEETYALMTTVRDRYPVSVQAYCPEAAELERYVKRNGPNAFYESVAQRQECRPIRKAEPLGRALEGKRAWITGLRREQSPTRKRLEVKGWDESHGLYKYNPLLDWSIDEVWAYVEENDVPYNALHDQGYPSIGCAPCTRAVKIGADPRAGRWWWEDSGAKECGLHTAGSS